MEKRQGIGQWIGKTHLRDTLSMSGMDWKDHDTSQRHIIIVRKFGVGKTLERHDTSRYHCQEIRSREKICNGHGTRNRKAGFCLFFRVLPRYSRYLNANAMQPDQETTNPIQPKYPPYDVSQSKEISILFVVVLNLKLIVPRVLWFLGLVILNAVVNVAQDGPHAIFVCHIEL